ncbi:hypothetical protein CLV84_1669 [Neolewinella xylanilytica]|uniref:Uncharacterized protein n=1 Tax=Neolewinella xylanilytica TaxID=1514080 RepID=A0A2S6IB68_9BACT|nr:hypothetical protein [Neolewinella xylanilytica]PPK88699.1 hypothetical protein CLV84_1669 [Neolewinella xylanilytica]
MPVKFKFTARGFLVVWLSGLLTLSMRPASFVLTLVEVEELVNDQVGEEWTHSVAVDGWQLDIYDSIDLASAEAYEIQCTSQEADPYYPDFGSRTLRMTEAEMVAAAATGGFTVEVTVQERHGEHAGKEAVWRYHFALR